MPETQVAPANPETTVTPAITSAVTSTTAPETKPETAGLFDHQAFPPETKPETKPETTTQKTDKPIEKVYAGRFKTPEDLEIAYRESSSEGMRLYQESVTMRGQLSELQSKIAEAEERLKIKVEMPFKELTKDQLEKLENESPVRAAEYLFEKKLHDRDVSAAQERQKSERAASEQKRAKTQAYIMERGKELSGNAEKYPHYNELIEDMDSLSKKLGSDIQNKGWAPDFLYLCALGRMHHKSILEGKKATAEALGKTKTEALASAAASASPGASTTEIPGKEDPNSDQAVMARIIKAGNKPYFKV